MRGIMSERQEQVERDLRKDLLVAQDRCNRVTAILKSEAEKMNGIDRRRVLRQIEEANAESLKYLFEEPDQRSEE